MKILLIAPHPDDEVLGCGGTIKKYSQLGDDIYLCVVTKAYAPDWSRSFIKNREKEIKCAVKSLGIKETIFLDFPTVKLDAISQKKLNDSISKCIQRFNPEIVFSPFYGDINKDHKLVSEATMVAVRPKPDSTIKRVLFYEVLLSAEGAFVPNIYEDIADFLDDKIKAMECYKSELRDYPHPRSSEGIKITAQKRGMESGVKAAEAFMLLREVVK